MIRPCLMENQKIWHDLKRYCGIIGKVYTVGNPNFKKFEWRYLDFDSIIPEETRLEKRNYNY